MADTNRKRNIASNDQWDKNQGRYVGDNNYYQRQANEGYGDLDRDGFIGETGGFYGGTSYTGSNYNDWTDNQQANRNRTEGNRHDYDDSRRNYRQNANRDDSRYDRRNGYTQSRYGNVNDNPYQDYRDYGNYSNYGNQGYRGDWDNRRDYDENRDSNRHRQSSYNSGYNNDYDNNYRSAGSYGSNDYNRPAHGDWGDASRGYNAASGSNTNRWNNEDRRNNAYGNRDRDWWDKTKDEVASWFGDEDAERRRKRDEQRAGEHKGKGPKEYQRSNDRIREDVCDRLSDDSFIDASDVDVKVENNEVTLSGTVDNRNAKRRAEDIIESIPGVRNVINNLRVSNPTTVGASTVRSSALDSNNTNSSL